MDKGKKKGFLFLAIFIAACVTLGGLGNIAVQEGIYWVAFVINVVVYGYILWAVYKGGQEKPAATTTSGKLRDPKTGRYVKSK